MLISNRKHPTSANENQAQYLIEQATRTILTRIFSYRFQRLELNFFLIDFFF